MAEFENERNLLYFGVTSQIGMLVKFQKSSEMLILKFSPQFYNFKKVSFGILPETCLYLP